ncbi:MAG: lysophospholipid acyltransferase family protein [Planctomycetota bacterium]
MTEPNENKQLRDPTRRGLYWRVWQVGSKILCKVLFGLRVYEKHHVPDSGGVLFVSNHQSFADPILVAVALKRPVAFLARSGLFKNPIFAWHIRQLCAFPLQEGKSDIGAMKQTIELIRAGWALNIFPEGERTPHGDLLPAKRGSALVMRKAKCTVIPLVIEGAFEAYPRTAKFPRFGKVGVLYGPPLKLDDVDTKDVPALIDETFKTMLTDLRQRLGRDDADDVKIVPPADEPTPTEAVA